MAKKTLQTVRTKGIGFAHVLKHFFDKAGIAEIIDDNVPLDPRRKILTHGEVAVAMITGILFQVSQLYKICQFADETTILEVILPAIASDQYFDDRLADTLDEIFGHGIGDLELLVTKNMIRRPRSGRSVAFVRFRCRQPARRLRPSGPAERVCV